MKWKIACIQLDITFGEPDANYRSVEAKLSEAANTGADVIVLPELWTTGYDLTRLDEIADHEAKRTIRFLKESAKKYKVHLIGGSVAKKTQGGVYNTLLIVNNKGELVKEYDKLHLFKLMDEHHFLQPGQKDGLFHLEDILLAGFICYDIRFPEWIRTHTSKGAQAIFVVAEWPKPRLAHWRSLLIARAIENQCFVIGVNRAGSDPANEFAGHSLIIDPWGEVIGEAGEKEEILAADIDFNKTSEVRNMIPVFQDRRPEFY
ncbi:carbon-nitrogen family hydrolase [Bacillus sp. V5-8f]|uniref:carbon-nitrogen family hydrolase n=1 Tax=Bacillus sp. V5-8f TaxID=2053044 RepID=UPI000C75E1D7|nr:carbon-nitrogen family hydrolase [Bacillus sp. V5-8f]PLT34984.1 carbon-nitrogen hydrolase [Bacillus sp. V5-8f]